MSGLKRLSAIVAIAIIFATGGCAGSGGFASKPLFDGRSLAGWEMRMIAEKGSATKLDRVFQVRDGGIHVYADAAPGSAQPHAILLTRREYADYRLHLQYRWGRNVFGSRVGLPRDAGVLLFVTDDGPDLDIWHHWPKSLEYQIMEGDSGSAFLLKARASGSVDPATRRYRPAADGGTPATARLIARDMNSFRLARRDTAERPGWNSVDIEVCGNSARFYLNELLVNEVRDVVEDRETAEVPMKIGRIGLQAESAEIRYRHIQIVENISCPFPNTSRAMASNAG